MIVSVNRIHDGLDRLQARGAAFIDGALDPNAVTQVAKESSSGNFERLAEHEGTARQDGEFFAVASPMNNYPLIAGLCAELIAVVHQQGSGIAGLKSWYPNEAWVQRYRSRTGGITVHKDLKRYRLLVAVFTVKGAAPFTVCRNRAGDAEMAWTAGPGSLVLLRGPGLGDIEDGRPLHAVGGPDHGERVSVSFRMNSRHTTERA